MNKKAVLMVLTAAVFWGCYGSFITLISGMGMPDGPLVFIRLLVTMLSMVVLIAVRDPSQFRIRRRDIPLFLANGICSIVFFTSCYTAAVLLTKIAVAASLLYTAPAIVLILSAVVFGEKVTARKAFCVLLSVAGCALVSGLTSGGLSISGKGLLLGLGAGFGYALYSIFSPLIFKRGYSSYTNILYTFLTASAFFLVRIILTGEYKAMAALPAATGMCLLCGLVTGTGAYTFYTNGLKQMEPSRAAQIATLEPVTAAILGAVLFHQTLSPMEILGVALVAGSVILMNAGTGAPENPPAVSKEKA